MSKCQSAYVTDSGHWGTDYVICEKPEGHKSTQHLFTYVGPRKGERETWTDAEAEE